MSICRPFQYASVISLLAIMGPLDAQGASTEPRVTFNYAHCCPAGQAYGIYAHHFADLVKAKSGGEIVVQVLDGGIMGSERVTAQKVQLGVVQMAGITANNVAQLAPSLNVLVMPYLTSSIQDFTGEGGLLHAGPYREELRRRVLEESGTVRIVGGYSNSYRSIFAKDQCIDSIDDLEGLKFRAPKNPVMTAMWNAWGVSPYPIAWSETYGAVSQGVIDAFDSPTDVILTMGFYEQIKYITESTYLPLAAVVVTNERWWQSLSDADRALIMEAANETDVFHGKWVRKNLERVRNTLVDEHGVTFCELKDPEVWKSRARGIWPNLYHLVGGGKSWVDATVKYLSTGETAW